MVETIPLVPEALIDEAVEVVAGDGLEGEPLVRIGRVLLLDSVAGGWVAASNVDVDVAASDGDVDVAAATSPMEDIGFPFRRVKKSLAFFNVSQHPRPPLGSATSGRLASQQ